MLATFFVHDDDGWRLKAMRKSHSSSGWRPGLCRCVSRQTSATMTMALCSASHDPPAVDSHRLCAGWTALFHGPGRAERPLGRAQGYHLRQDRSGKRNSSIASDEQWIVWCGLNEEADSLARTLDDSVNVKGSDSAEDKARMLEGFQDGAYKVLITKAKIAGFGMNFQNAHNMAFVGMSDSWEAYYQCIRREYRFGQQNPVNVTIIITEQEEPIYQNVMRKEKEAAGMASAIDRERPELRAR